MERKFEGIWIPRDLWFHEDLTLIEKCFLCEIKSLDNKDGCYASNSHFSEWSGLTAQRCSQIIKSLEEKKFISIRYERDGKEVKKRVVNILDRVSNIFAKGIKEIHGGYQENAKGRLTTEINSDNISSKGILPYEWKEQVPQESITGSPSWISFTRQYNASKGRRAHSDTVKTFADEFVGQNYDERKSYKEWCVHFGFWLKKKDLPNIERVAL